MRTDCRDAAEPPSLVRMRVLFFAQLRQVTGVDEVQMASDQLDAAGLWNKLIERWPDLQKHREPTRLARNGVYVGPEDIFRKGDEVALIPPVSGG